MNKTIAITALALTLAATTAFAASDKKHKDKNKATEETVVAPVELKTSNDTLSYAAGMEATGGLISYITTEYGVDTAYIASFIEGYLESAAVFDDPEYEARAAGVQIANFVEKNVVPKLMENFEDTPYQLNPAVFNQGFVAALSGDSTVYTVTEGSNKYREIRDSAVATKLLEYNKKNKAWLEENATKEGVVTTESGLQYKVIVQGDGEIPEATNRVQVRYEGKLIDGTVFDSSYERGDDPVPFRADMVIKGWTEALTMMPVGSTWELYIPSELAYGERKSGKIKPFSTLIFKVELVDTNPNPAPREKSDSDKRREQRKVKSSSEKKAASANTDATVTEGATEE